MMAGWHSDDSVLKAVGRVLADRPIEGDWTLLLNNLPKGVYKALVNVNWAKLQDIPMDEIENIVSLVRTALMRQHYG